VSVSLSAKTQIILKIHISIKVLDTDQKGSKSNLKARGGTGALFRIRISHNADPDPGFFFMRIRIPITDYGFRILIQVHFAQKKMKVKIKNHVLPVFLLKIHL